MEYGVKSETLAGLVFDTTATNSGLLNGVLVRLQTLLGGDYMQLACRHHILELVCGKAVHLSIKRRKTMNRKTK